MDCKILSISDLHIGHPKVSCLAIRDRLMKYFLPYVQKADILFICGDIYHILLNMSGQEARIAISFLVHLLKEAERYDTIIRIIRGTYTHDRDQSKILKTIHNRSGFDVDFNYYDIVTGEYIDKLDLRVMYIPDDIPFGSSDEVMTQIVEYMSMMGWSAIDVVCGHGYFKHKLPPGMPHDPKITFRRDQFTKILSKDGIILMGHDHSMSQSGKVVYNGSFDRLAHGEEMKKGFIFIDRKIQFIENPEATIFKTIDLSELGEDKEQLIQHAVGIVQDTYIPEHQGYYRIIHPKSEIRQLLVKVLGDRFKYLKFTHKSNQVASTHDLNLDSLSMEHLEEIQVNDKNLPIMIRDYLADNNKELLSEKEITDMLSNTEI